MADAIHQVNAGLKKLISQHSIGRHHRINKMIQNFIKPLSDNSFINKVIMPFNPPQCNENCK